MTEKFEFIDAEYAASGRSGDEHVPSVVKMCRWMEVSRSGFYEWRNAPESATAAVGPGTSAAGSTGAGNKSAALTCIIA